MNNKKFIYHEIHGSHLSGTFEEFVQMLKEKLEKLEAPEDATLTLSSAYEAWGDDYKAIVEVQWERDKTEEEIAAEEAVAAKVKAIQEANDKKRLAELCAKYNLEVRQKQDA